MRLNSLVTITAAGIAALIVGCASSPPSANHNQLIQQQAARVAEEMAKREAYVAEHPELPPEIREALLNATISLAQLSSAESDESNSADKDALEPTTPTLELLSARLSYINSHPRLDRRIREALLAGRIVVGMTTVQVKLCLGNPEKRDISHTTSGLIEQWSYSGPLYLKFEQGILLSIRDEIPGESQPPLSKP